MFAAPRRSGHPRPWWLYLYFAWRELISVSKGFHDAMATTAYSMSNHPSTSLTLLSLMNTPPSTPDAVDYINHQRPSPHFLLRHSPISTGDFLHPSSHIGYGDLSNSTRTRTNKWAEAWLRELDKPTLAMSLLQQPQRTRESTHLAEWQLQTMTAMKKEDLLD